METVPEWPAYIRSITGWPRVEPGTLTLADVDPLPGTVFGKVEPLGAKPDNLFDQSKPEYADFLRRVRGQRRYYGGLACSIKGSHVAIVSFQDMPPSPHWLDVYSNVKLRDALDLQTDDQVTIKIFHAADWHEAPT